MADVEKLIAEVEVKDQLSKPFADMAKQTAKLGASSEETEQALRAQGEAAVKNGVSMGVAARAYKGLLPEVQDVGEASKHLGIILKHQTATGINDTAKAAQEIGDVLGGGTKALRNYDQAAIDAAARIDKIKNPAKRAELAMQELEAAIKRQNSTLGKAKARVAAFSASMSKFQPLAVGGGAALGAMAGVIGGVLISSIKHYVSESAVMQKSLGSLNKAVDEFKFQLGGAIVATTKSGSALDTMTGIVKVGTAWVKKNQAQIGVWTKTVVRGAIIVGKVVGNIALGIAEFVSFTVEGITGLVGAALGPIAELGKDLVHVLNGLGIVSDDVMLKLQDFFLSIKNASDQTNFDFAFTTQITSLQEGFNDLANSALDSFSAIDKGAGKVNIGRRKGKGGGKKAEGGDYANAGYTPEGLGILDEVMTGDPIAEVGVVFGEVFMGITTGFKAATAEGTQFAAMMDRVNSALFEMESGKVIAAELNGALGTVANGALNMADALASGSMAIKDIRVAVVDGTSDILQSSGKALAEHAIKSGLIFQAFGTSLEALAILSPGGMLLAGGGLIAAGLLLKKGLGSGSVAKGGAAKRADSQAAGALEQLGRKISGTKQEEGRVINAQFGDRQIRGIIRDEVNDGARRRQYGSLPFSSSTALGG